MQTSIRAVPHHAAEFLNVEDLPQALVILSENQCRVNTAARRLFNALANTVSGEAIARFLKIWLAGELLSFRASCRFSQTFSKRLINGGRSYYLEITLSRRGGGPADTVVALRDASPVPPASETEATGVYRALFEHSAVPMLLLDEKMRVILINDAYARLCGQDQPAAPIGRRARLDFLPAPLADILRRAAGDATEHHIFDLVDDQGRIKYIRATFSTLPSQKKAVTLLDLTSYKELLQELRLERRQSDRVFERNPIAALLTRLDGTILNVNQRFCRSAGQDREYFLGRNFLELIDEPPGVREKYLRLLLRNRSLENIEVRFHLPGRPDDARTGLLAVEMLKYRNEPRLLIALNDITKVKNIEQEMARIERLNLAGELAASIGHEVRNPLTTIRGFLQMLQDKPACSHHRSYFQLMIEELDRANSIITEYLSLAKPQPQEMKRQNLNDIIKALLPLLQSDALRCGQEIRVQLSPLPLLALDGKSIRQLILNLARNGLEAMRGCGRLTIHTRENDDAVVLAVEDQGCGIPDSIRGKVGSPFFTTKENGTGLGLSVCQSVARRHRAALAIDSAPGKTTISVLFPRP